ncbi:glycoside hydrolase [Mucilaginibacter terrae]|uniref:GH39 family glycosyl hydrolase n=1 Tax=Mucilaginibacter terrae TaxID=1955052 RepID=UPI00364328FD
MKYTAITCFLAVLLLFIFNCKAADTDSTRVIKIDITKVAGTRSHVYQECVGAGRASEGLRADWQEQLTLIKKEVGFKYIRFHGLLNDDMHAYTEDAKGNPVYNWQYVDKLYDFLLRIKVRPFVEFGFMPPALASGEKTVFWWKGNITPPKSYEKWSAFITAMVKHFEERYGKKEVEQWYFEVWNEPNLKEFFGGDIKEYFKLYVATAKAVKIVSTTYRVGGPATSGSTWIKEALEEFATYPQLVDFISTHAYGTRSVFDEFGKRRTQMREADGIPIAVNKVRQDVNASALSKREIHITEWNSSPNPLDPLHDTYQNAAYVLNVLKKTEHLVNSMSYWTFTDIFEEAGPPLKPFHGGFGLLNLQSIKKPSYFAYKFINELGERELVNTDRSSWICKDSKGNIQVLFWDYRLLSPDSSYNQQFYSKLLPSKAVGTVKLSVDHLTNGKYKLQIYRVGYMKNDPYTSYLKMGSPSYMSQQQENSLKAIANGAPDKELNIDIRNGKWTSAFELKQNETFFIKLNRIN